jgi:hypothetical protein
MQMSARCRVLLSLAVALALGMGQAALATTSYPNYFGPNVSFTGTQETSTFGDPEPLFGAPTGSLDQLLFFPTNFTASASGAGGSDSTGSQLQTLITSTAPGAKINILNISEFGDAALTGTGTSATGVMAGMSGFVTVLEVNGAAITPVIIGFNAGGMTPVNGSFSPVAVGFPGLTLPGNAGTTIWSGSVSINIASIVPNATKVMLSFDNDLYAYSEAGTTAKIQKKVVDGPAIVIQVIPEPGTAALLGGGLLALSLRKRARRA